MGERTRYQELHLQFEDANMSSDGSYRQRLWLAKTRPLIFFQVHLPTCFSRKPWPSLTDWCPHAPPSPVWCLLGLPCHQQQGTLLVGMSSIPLHCETLFLVIFYPLFKFHGSKFLHAPVALLDEPKLFIPLRNPIPENLVPITIASNTVVLSILKQVIGNFLLVY